MTGVDSTDPCPQHLSTAQVHQRKMVAAKPLRKINTALLLKQNFENNGCMFRRKEAREESGGSREEHHTFTFTTVNETFPKVFQDAESNADFHNKF